MSSHLQSRWRQMGRSFLTMLPALFVIGLLGWGAFEFLRAFLSFLQELESDLATAFVAGSAAVVASVISLAVGKAYETRAAIQSDLRQKKAPIYEKIVGTVFEVVFAANLGKKPVTQAKLLEFFATTTEKLAIWGSDAVLNAWSDFKTVASEKPTDMMFGFERLVLAIRKDLGHKNRGIGKTSILRLFVTDIDEYLANPAQQGVERLNQESCRED